MKYIPRPVVVGFTNGIAVVIASTQLKDFFGLRIENVPGNFLGRLEAVAQNSAQFPGGNRLAVLALALILVCRNFPKIPGYIVALFVGTCAGLFPSSAGADHRHALWRNSFRTARAKIPQFHLDLIRPLIAPAITVAMLGAIESLMSAVVADRMVGTAKNTSPTWS